MDEKMKKSIEAIVASIFSEKEEADARTATEAALGASATTIDELTTSLEEKNTEVEEMASKVTASEERISTLESELEAAKTETETSKDKLSEAEKTIDDMIKDKAADERMSGLEEAGVARTDKDAQRKKIREMSDEDFAAYKEELTSIRQSVLDELEEAKKALEAKEETDAATAAAAKDVTGEEGEEGEEEGSEEDDDEDEVDTAPANIDPGQAVASAMNLEIFPSDDVLKKYGALGDAMAAAFKTEKKEV